MWLSQFLRDRRVVLLLLLTVLVWVVGRHVLASGVALRAVVHGGYWVMLAAFVLWGRALYRLARRDGWRGPADAKGWGVVALVLVGAWIWQSHETRGYKVLADEILLVGTSQSLHLDRQVGYGVRATEVQGGFQLLQSVLDKRPYFYPFLVSLVHDLTGYRVENAFWLNTALGVVFLGLLYALAKRAGGGRGAGVFAVVVAIGLPLLAQQAAGAGFELLNLCLIAGWWWLAMRLLSAPDDEAQDAFVLTAVLLASTRYESLLFLPVTALILLVSWRRESTPRITATTFAAPVLVLPMLWLNRVFAASEANWQMASRGADAPFGLQYLPDNLGHALQFFFSFDGYQPNSPYLALLGLPALPLFVLWAQRVWRAPVKSGGDEAGLALGALGPLAVSALLMVYFWGQIDDPVIRRLGLPLQLLMLVATVAVVGRVVPRGVRAWPWLSGGAAVALVAFAMPVMTRNAYGHDYSPGVAYAWRREFLARQPERDFLVIDRDAFFWITEGLSATPVAQAQARRDGIAYHVRNHSFSATYVYQSFNIQPETGELVLDPADDLGADFELEPVAQQKTSVLQMGRFSRVVAIRDGEKEIARASAPLVPDDSSLKPAEVDAAKRAYLERWVKELP